MKVFHPKEYPSSNVSIVSTNKAYTYDIMKEDIKNLKKKYPFLEIETAGSSVLGRNLYYIKLGKGPNQVFFNGAHHGLEWITSLLLVKFIENFCQAYTEHSPIRGYDVQEVWDQSTLYILPMINPDGVDLVLNGLQPEHPFYKDLLCWNKENPDFSKVWQANSRGVDLNHNYDACWNLSKEAEPSYGIYGPGPTRFGGPHPESEPETKAVADFTRSHDFRLVLAYHSQGEEIFWNYQDLASIEGKKIGELFAQVSGYILSETTGITSYAGYKDWFIEKYKKPGYTIEVGKGVNPLPIEQFNKIYNDNEELLLLASMI